MSAPVYVIVRAFVHSRFLFSIHDFISALSAFVGPVRLTSEERRTLVRDVLPWAISTGTSAVFLMNVFYEKHFAEPLDSLRERLRVKPYPFPTPPDPMFGHRMTSTATATASNM
jgi:ubiquinone biosynthesis protein Coq4